MTSGRLQEHYIIQAWTPELGWARAESTMARFPWQDTENLVLRVVYPDSKRSSGDVPLFFELSGGASGGFDMAEDTCWQGADMVAMTHVPTAGLEWVRTRADEAFEALVDEPAAGDAVRLAPAPDAPDLDARTIELLERVDTFISP